jgi:YrbI family 3-deoxy-D-manno-octulosonate 8-phosphate phosphatase
MKKIAIIPLRAGSVGIPFKNKKKLFGRPLYQWVLTEAIFSELDEIYIFTDDEEILLQIDSEYSWSKKVKSMPRSAESATDTASTEFAMLELAEKINYKFDIFCLLQATSPLTSRKDINECISNVENSGFDSALTVVETKRFFWNEKGQSLNYDYLKRPRRQDFEGQLVENGSVYAIKKETFLKTHHRLGGKIGVVRMPNDSLTEIDEMSDWTIIEKLIEDRLSGYKRNPSKIRAMVFDVDGVFTDGTVAVSEEKELFKSFSLRDGMGFALLRQSNILPIVITSENAAIVTARMKKLRIENVLTGVNDKFSRLEYLLGLIKISRNEIAYVGDDINDLANLASSGWSMCPNNAVESVIPYVDLRLNANGGDKAIRESIEFIIKYNKKF